MFSGGNDEEVGNLLKGKNGAPTYFTTSSTILRGTNTSLPSAYGVSSDLSHSHFKTFFLQISRRKDTSDLMPGKGSVSPTIRTNGMIRNCIPTTPAHQGLL